MGFFDIFVKKNKNDETEKSSTPVNVNNVSAETKGEATDKAEIKKDTEKKIYVPMGSFALGVENFARMRESDDLVIVGTVNGTIEVGMTVYATNFGDDDKRSFETKVLGIRQKGKQLIEAKSGVMEVLLEDADERGIKPGTVIHTVDADSETIQKAYVNAIGNTFVMRKDFDLSDADFNIMSITDCAECWSMFAWLKRQMAAKISPEENEKIKAKVERMGKKLGEKILNADEIYVPYSTVTNEPYLFTQTISRPDGSFMCTPPEIMVITKAYLDIVSKQYSEDKFEIRKIENDSENQAIKKFLQDAFYINGACAAVVLNRSIGIEASVFVEAPDLAGDPDVKVPVTNPALLRWMLLLAQLGKPENSDEERNYQLYFRFFAKELQKAKLLVPAKFDGEASLQNQVEKEIRNKETKMEFPVMEGTSGRKAIAMFTDWRRFNVEFPEGWECTIQSVGGVMDVMDCAINSKGKQEIGAYITEEIFAEVKKIESK